MTESVEEEVLEEDGSFENEDGSFTRKEREAPPQKELDPFENYTIPEQYGDASCSLCRGRGRLLVPNPPGYRGPSALKLCQCVIVRDLRANLERGFAGLTSAFKLKTSHILGKETQNLWVTADEDWFRAHLRYVALRHAPTWDFRVVTDADLIQAWLATAAAKGMEIFDADARREAELRSLRYMTLTDIAASASLLVIRLGVKTAANREMPNVFLETLLMRAHMGLPTWVWDQPLMPLAMGHLCWSEQVQQILEGWPRAAGKAADLEEVVPVPVPRPRRMAPLELAPHVEIYREPVREDDNPFAARSHSRPHKKKFR